MSKHSIKKVLRESSEINKTDVQTSISKNLNSKEFKDKVETIIKNKLKNDKELEDKIVEITKNVLTQLYKTLWVKRGFWSTQLTNKNS